MTTITSKTKAWISVHGSPDALFGDDKSAAVDELSFSQLDMKSAGWTYVGEATITVDVPDQDALIGNKVESLRAEKQKVLAEAQAKATQLEGQIQKLLAITYTPAVA
jgi:hypothetical protein